VTCWSCGGPTRADDRCNSCGALQPAPAGEDLFAALGVPRRFDQDAAELERRFRERARAFHPDRFARAPARERRIALERSARLNEAHRTVVPPRRRAVYLLQLLAAGDEPPPYDTRVPRDRPPPYGAGEARAAGQTVTDPALLEEQLAIRERIEAARAAGDAAELARLAGGLSSRLAAIDHRLGELLAGDAPAVEARRAASRLLDEARLLERALELAQGGAELR
jgi:molecular chaperone HscB